VGACVHGASSHLRMIWGQNTWLMKVTNVGQVPNYSPKLTHFLVIFHAKNWLGINQGDTWILRYII